MSSLSAQPTPSDMPSLAEERRNFFGGLWHGVFLSLGMTLTQPTTAIAAFVADLTGSTVWVGSLSTVLTVAGVLPQPLVARWIEPRRTKMPVLLLAIYLRMASWGALAWLVHTLGSSHPELLAWILVGLLGIFCAGGGLGGIPYTDIIGKVIPLVSEGPFSAAKRRWPVRWPWAQRCWRGISWPLCPIPTTTPCCSGWRQPG